MISDEERREVATRLRSMKPEETTFPFGKPVLMHIFRSVFPNQMFLTNWILRLPYQLADLIDRPTCEYVPIGNRRFGCSWCGHVVRLDYDELIADEIHMPFNYCPNCGAEVVEDV